MRVLAEFDPGQWGVGVQVAEVCSADLEDERWWEGPVSYQVVFLLPLVRVTTYLERV